MDMVDRYLEAVAAQLPADERDDIIAELRDLILSRIEAKEEALGRAATDDEREAILKEIGHPLVVAARYRKGPDSLIGPELFPYWLYGVKAGLLILGAVSAVSLVLHLLSVPEDAGQMISHAFNGFFGAGLTLIGALTLAGAIMEHYAIRPKWLTDWRVKDLGAFQLSDPASWGVAAKTASESKRAPWAPKRSFGRYPGGEAIFSAIALTMFVLWWVGVLHIPGLMTFDMFGTDTTVTPAPIWATLYTPILVYALFQIAVELYRAFRPDQVRLTAVLSLVIALAGLWLTWTIFEAGHWFTLTQGPDQAMIAGDWVDLSFDRLRELQDGPRTLARVASMTSLIATWILAISGVSLACKVLMNLWRIVRG